MPVRRTVATVAAIALWAVPAFAQSPVLEEEAGHWQQVRASGLLIYRTNQQTGAAHTALSVDCDEAHTLDHSWTGLSLTLNGKMLPPGTPVTFTAAGESVTFQANKAGGASTDTPDAARKFRKLWPLLREGASVNIVASDGSAATLALDGTAALMPPEPCQTP